MFITYEGADFVEGDFERIDEAHAAGVRSITVVHYRQNEFGDLQTEPLAHGGLTAAGRELVRVIDRVSDEHARAVADCGGLIGVDHVAIGTDMDANFKSVMTNYDGFAALEIALGRRGFAPAEVDRILGGNAVELIRQVCG